MTDSALADVVRAYVAAWNTPDLAAREELLQRSFAADGSYADPAATVAGREALVVHARRFAQRWPAAVITLTSGIDSHGAVACFTWRLADADGDVLREGIDFVRAGEDGRITEVRGFFGAYRSPSPVPPADPHDPPLS
jgi:ketosteroid isomerase-like protein